MCPGLERVFSDSHRASSSCSQISIHILQESGASQAFRSTASFAIHHQRRMLCVHGNSYPLGGRALIYRLAGSAAIAKGGEVQGLLGK